MWKFVACAVMVSTVLAGCKGEEAKAATYVSPTGFMPLRYTAPGSTGTYTLLDAIPQDGDVVEYVTSQELKRGTNVFHRSANCKTWKFMTIGQGESLKEMMEPHPDRTWYDLRDGSVITAGAVKACKAAGII